MQQTVYLSSDTQITFTQLYSIKADLTPIKTVFLNTLHHWMCNAFVKLHACNYCQFMA